MNTKITEKDFNFKKISQSKQEVEDIDFDFSKKIEPTFIEDNTLDYLCFFIGGIILLALFSFTNFNFNIHLFDFDSWLLFRHYL